MSDVETDKLAHERLMNRLWQAKYRQTEKGKAYIRAYRKAYSKSEKGKAVLRKYYVNYIKSEKAKIARKENCRKWRKKPESKIKMREYATLYRQTIKGKISAKERARKYANTTQGKLKRKQWSIKRRDLGFIPLNKYFNGAAAHHFDKEHIVFIPLNLHKSVSHNVWTGRNMDKINSLCKPFLEIMSR